MNYKVYSSLAQQKPSYSKSIYLLADHIKEKFNIRDKDSNDNSEYEQSTGLCAQYTYRYIQFLLRHKSPE